VIRQSWAVLLLVASLAACARENNSSAAAPAANTVATAAAGAGSPAGLAALATATPGTSAQGPGDLAAAAATQQEGSDTGTSTDSGDTQLERIAALPAEGQLPAVKWVAGTQYKVIAPAEPTNVEPGKVEVLEFFWFGCPHCYALDAAVESWRKNKADYIQFTRVPVTWAEVHRAHARLFYTLVALGKEDELHTKVFDTIHQERDPLYVPGNPPATAHVQSEFAKENGISEADFTKAYNSFAVLTNLQEADDLGRRYRIDAVPTFTIAGKYLTDMSLAGGLGS